MMKKLHLPGLALSLLLTAAAVLTGWDVFSQTAFDVGTPGVGTHVRGSVTIRNNTFQTANDFHARLKQKENWIQCNGVSVTCGGPFTVGSGTMTNAGRPNGPHGANIHLSGGDVAPGGEITLNADFWLTEWNSIFIDSIVWTYDGVPLGAGNGAGQQVAPPEPGGSGGNQPGGGAQEGNGGTGNHVHKVTIYNEDFQPHNVTGLKLLASMTYYTNLSDINWDTISTVTTGITYPLTIPANDSVVYQFQTTGSYVGGHVYLTYTLASDTLQISMDHPVEAACTFGMSTDGIGNIESTVLWPTGSQEVEITNITDNTVFTMPVTVGSGGAFSLTVPAAVMSANSIDPGDLTKVRILDVATYTHVVALNQSQVVYYTGNPGNWYNWDLYSYNLLTGTETRLTYNQAIDNHPDLSHLTPNRLVFSSNRGNGEFDIYVADASNVDGTAVRLTFDNYPGLPVTGAYPDRHPHWHPNGELIVFTTKNRAVILPDSLITECSHPTITHFINVGGIIIKYRLYEGMNVIKIDAAGNVISYTPLNVRKAWDSINYPNIWIHSDATYVGHPSFNSAGDKVVFTAAIDGEGKNWEVYRAGFDPVSRSLIPNSLRRVTYGPNETMNPIKMSGGAKYSNDDAIIYFNSTRITSGNSQIYSVPASAIDCPVTSATQLTFHGGNDYVPQPVPGTNKIMITSDLGQATICQPPGMIVGGPTEDFDVVILDQAGRTIIGNPFSQQTIFLPDEVAWFCGSKPNLSACTFHPRIMKTESIWIMHDNNYMVPDSLLSGYGLNYCCNARELYGQAFFRIMNTMYSTAPDLLGAMMNDVMSLSSTWPGWNDPLLLMDWFSATQELRNKKYVVPASMDGFGLANTGMPITVALNYAVVSGTLSSMAQQVIYTSENSPGSYFLAGPGTTTYLMAGQKVLLKPGTVIEAGAVFYAGPMMFLPIQSPEGKPVTTLPEVTAAPDEELPFKLYPNPARESFWIEFQEGIGPGQTRIEVFDFTGTEILEKHVFIEERYLVPLHGWIPGPYFVKVTMGDRWGSRTLIIKK